MKPPISLPDDLWRFVLKAKIDDTNRDLKGLLGVTNPRRDFNGVPFHRFFRAAKDAIKRGDRKDAEFSSLPMFKLLEDLKRIREAKPELFKHFRQRMRRCGKEEYRGLRFEIGTASALLRMQVQFDMPSPSNVDSPDFLVSYADDVLTIECTAPQITASATPDLLYKVFSKLNEKSQKSYADAKTIVMIDITDLVFSRSENSLLNNLNLRADVSRFVSDLPIASAILILYDLRLTTDAFQISRSYLRCDSRCLSAEPRNFLERYYPQNNVITLNNCAIPFQP